MRLPQPFVGAIVVATLCLPKTLTAVVIATSKGIGADAEVRDHQPTTNFGASTELGTRILDNFPLGHASDGTDRFSAMYLKFDLTGVSTIPAASAKLRLTYRNTNLTANRIHDTGTPNLELRTGLAIYGLDRDNAGNNWNEATITYVTAPGLANGGDFNNGTKDFDFVDPDGAGPLRAPLTPLGVALFPEVAPQNRLPAGGALQFTSAALTNFVNSSLTTGKTSITFVAAILHDGKVPINDWKNFNYLFNPKEQTTLVTDTGYDADTTNPNNPLGSPWSGASNAEDASGFSPFSPQLIYSAHAGDFDSDGDVDGADFVAWQTNFPKASGATLAQGDADGDGDVDGADFVVWQTNFPFTPAPGDSPVPEPAAWILALVASVGSLRLVYVRTPRKMLRGNDRRIRV